MTGLQFWDVPTSEQNRIADLEAENKALKAQVEPLTRFERRLRSDYFWAKLVVTNYFTERRIMESDFQ